MNLIIVMVQEVFSWPNFARLINLWQFAERRYSLINSKNGLY